MPARPLHERTPRQVTWLWPGRLALGKLAMLDGDPGLGKSLVCLDLCARLSTGRPFPDGSPAAGPGVALILNGEDGEEDTVHPRLLALGADLNRVFTWESEGETGELLRLPADTEKLDRALTQSGARLLVIDPVMAFLERGVLAGSDQSIRRALFPLAWLAERRQCAVLLVRHLNKSGGGRALYRGGGSIAFLAACRSGWLVAREPHCPERCVLAQVKNNLVPPQPSLGYTVQVQEGAPPTLSWLGPCPWRADELLAGTGEGPRLRPRDLARDFLLAFLDNGPRTSRQVWDAAREQGLADRTLQRAKQALEVRSVRLCLNGNQRCYWLLPGQELPESVPPESAPPDLEEWLGPLRAQFPPATPIDDL